MVISVTADGYPLSWPPVSLADCEDQARREREMHDWKPEPSAGPILWHDDKPVTRSLLGLDGHGHHRWSEAGRYGD